MSTVFALQPPVVSQTFQHTCPGAQAAAWSVYVTTDIAAMTVVNAKASAITPCQNPPRGTVTLVTL
jgi:hypothetical protein